MLTSTMSKNCQNPVAVPLKTRRTDLPELFALVQYMDRIDLKGMDAVALMDRIDTKYCLPTERLIEAIEVVKDQYRILCVNGQCVSEYATLYFDTPDLQLFNQHVRGCSNRYKVRSREYMSSRQSFLEVKHKTPRERTIKQRITTQQFTTRLTGSVSNWLDEVYPFDNSRLIPALWNSFYRLTLVSKACCERVTIDVELGFRHGSRLKTLPGLAVVEIKTDHDNQGSILQQQLRSMRQHPQGFSKYCMGVALLYNEVKKNSLKPGLLSIQKITGETYCD